MSNREAEVIRAVWAAHGTAEAAVLPGLVAPDSHIEFIFHLGSPWRMKRLGVPEWAQQPTAFIYGQNRRCLQFAGTGEVSLVALRVSPVVAATLLGRSLSDLWDQPVPLEDLIGTEASELLDRLRIAADADRFSILRQWVGKQIDIAASSGADGLLERVVQPKGNVFYDVGKRKAKKLRVETPYLVAVIKGTQFNVAAQDESATVSLFEGHLEIWTPDDSDVVQLNAGEIATHGRNDRSIRVLRMDTGETIRARNDASSDGTDSRLTASVTGGVPIDDRTGPLGGGDQPIGIAPVAGPVSVAADLNASSPSALESAKSGIAPSLDASVAASVDIGAVDGTVGIEAGPTGVGATVDAAVDLGAASVDAGAAATVDVANASVDVGVSTAVVDVPVVVDAAVSLDSSPAVDVGVVAGAVDAGLGVDLGTGAVAVDLGTTTIETPPVVPTVVDEVVAPLLRGLLGQ